jgi:hypothetical protein
MRRKPWVREELAESKFFIDNPTENIGKWHKAFRRKKQPLHLELRMWKRKFYSKTCSSKSGYKLFGNRYKK